ncbi:MAG TPA: serine/threonine-protein kinase [Rhodanobacteraceae bacterium]
MKTSSRRAFDVFERSLGCAANERAGFLDRECADDAELRREVERLLAADEAADAFLERPFGAAANRSGEQFGPWRIVREIGHGGMGTVYLAERSDALYDKKVALKLLRFDAGDLRARFANERRILATLEHPNIARLLDAGIDAGGVPYVAMEYVEGESITKWCDVHELDVAKRIALFLKVLDAVQSAHGKLVVHRDLKPANILVDASGEPKLLDFGIAKLLDAELRGLTQTGFAPLTPEYASPEQVRGEPIGTASDIYALGVLAYELCAGERPYRIASTAPREIERVVCETDPVQPSTVARTNARAKLDHDLDHVILRAMAKSPADRYASCAQFADDLRRFLAGQPVLARHAGWRYRAGKFVRRHRASVAAATLIAAMLVASTFVALRQAYIARAERDKAERISTFLQDMLAAADPNERGRNVTVAEVLDTAAGTLEQTLHDEPDVVASLRLTLSDTYLGLGLLDSALAQARAAVALVDGQGHVDADTRGRAYEALAEALHARSDDVEARRWAERTAALTDPSAIAWVGQAENMLGIIDRHEGHFDEAARHYRRALDVYRGNRAVPESHVANVLNDLAILKIDQGHPADAIPLQEEALAITRRIHPGSHPQTATMLSSLGDSRAMVKDFTGAETAFQDALSMRSALLGEQHPDTILTLTSYANMLAMDLHRYADAEPFARRAWDAARAKLPDPHQQTAYAGLVLAECLVQQGRAAEAVPILRKALAMRRQMLPAGSPLIASSEGALGAALVRSGNVAEGEPLLRGAVARLTESVGPDHPITKATAARLAAFEASRAH